MNLSLTPELERIVREQVESGRYGSSGEVVRDALLLLERRERERTARLEELRQEIQKGIDSGPPIPAEEVFARLRARIAAVAADPEA
jgi:antitoxin ParD1/3/4